LIAENKRMTGSFPQPRRQNKAIEIGPAQPLLELEMVGSQPKF
jgi:hypothetical protein